jgi:50S ribosomal subunit-associated GTPase HflX
VINKVDLLSELEAKSLVNTLGGLAVSALRRDGFQELIMRIQDELNRTFPGRDPGGFLDIAPQ